MRMQKFIVKEPSYINGLRHETGAVVEIDVDQMTPGENLELAPKSAKLTSTEPGSGSVPLIPPEAPN